MRNNCLLFTFLYVLTLWIIGNSAGAYEPGPSLYEGDVAKRETVVMTIPDRQGIPIILRPVEDEQIARLVQQFLENKIKISHQGKLQTNSKTYYAKLDIDADGKPELFLQFDQNAWCGNDDCQVFVFHNKVLHEKGDKGLEPICKFYAHSAYGDTTWISTVLPETEHGYRILQLRQNNLYDNGFVRWSDKKDKQGNFCWLDAGKPIPLKAVREPEIHDFTMAYLRQLGVSGTDMMLQKMTWNDVQYADVDLNGDGVADRVLALALPVKCDKPGCEGAIFVHSDTEFKQVCNKGIFPEGVRFDPFPRVRLFDKVENGFRLLNTGADILHWRSQKGADGNLCWTFGAH